MHNNSRLSAHSRTLWAKTGDESSWLSLEQHMIDSSDAAGFLFDEWLSNDIKALLQQKLLIDEAELRILTRWLAGTHDVGKATKSFQFQLDYSKHSWLSENVRNSGLSSKMTLATTLAVEYIPHSVSSYGILQHWLETKHDWHPKSAEMLATIIGSHHGYPPLTGQLSKLDNLNRVHESDWKDSWEELLSAITKYVQAEDVLVKYKTLRVPVTAQMILTGLVVMSDWIASNTDLFPLSGPEIMSIEKTTTTRSQHAFSLLAPPPPWVPSTDFSSDIASFYQQRFSWPPHFKTNSLQQKVAEIATNATSATMLIIEAPMGGGKTEAGLAAADLLAQKLNSGGVMFGTPTTASSDGLFERTITWAKNTQDQSAVTSMFLAHSKNTLNTNFMNLRFPTQNRFIESEQESHESRVMQHDWFYGRYKGVLSHVVLGTVDQILRVALQSKHVMLRHLALAGKVIIIDEVHAYDSYMQTYLGRAIEWLGAYGVSVILLSATLPESIRNDLAHSYRRGLGAGVVPTEQTAEKLDLTYPRITEINSKTLIKHEINQISKNLCIQISEINDSLEQLEASLSTVHEKGGCAVVICNTVSRAQNVYDHLQVSFGDDVSLLHARFTARDRKEKEEKLLAKFGPKSNLATGRPKRHVLVATQIVEQSLDLDFDLMITDFCPADLLLQRAGRLHRHNRAETERPKDLRKPVLLVRGIEAQGSLSKVPVFNTHSTLIYSEAVLIASYSNLLNQLSGAQKLCVPEEISEIVQKTYLAEPDVPPSWLQDFTTAQTKLKNHIQQQRNKAQAYLLGQPKRNMTIGKAMPSREAEVKEHLQEIKAAAQVRDIEPSLEVLLVTQNAYDTFSLLPGQGDSEISFYGGNPVKEDIAQEIALNSVRLPHYYSIPHIFDAALDELESKYFFDAWQQSIFLKGQLILPLNSDNETVLVGRKLRYSSELGLQLLPQNKTNDRELS